MRERRRKEGRDEGRDGWKEKRGCTSMTDKKHEAFLKLFI